MMAETGRTPTPGRIVMFRHHDGATWPALVLNAVATDPEATDVDHRVNLHVFTTEGWFIEYNVPNDESEQTSRTWHWPTRVP